MKTDGTQINIKDPANTPADESLPYRVGYLVASWNRTRRNSRKDWDKSKVIRNLIDAAYEKQIKQDAE